MPLERSEQQQREEVSASIYLASYPLDYTCKQPYRKQLANGTTNKQETKHQIVNSTIQQLSICLLEASPIGRDDLATCCFNIGCEKCKRTQPCRVSVPGSDCPS